MVAIPEKTVSIQEEIDLLQLAIAELEESNLPKEKLSLKLEDLEAKRISCSAYLFCAEGDRVTDRLTGEVGTLVEKVDRQPGSNAQPQVVVQFSDRLQKIDPAKLIIVPEEEELTEGIYLPDPKEEVSEAETYLTDPEEEVSEAETYLTDPKEEVSEAETYLTDPEEEVSEAETYLTDPEEEVSEAETYLTDPEEEVSEAETYLTDPEEEVSEAETYLTDPEEEVSEAETYLTDPEEEVSEAETYLTDPEEEVSEVEAKTKEEIPNLRFEEPDWEEIEIDSLDEFGQLYITQKLEDPQGILLAKNEEGTYFILGRDAEKWKYFTGTMLNKRKFGSIKLRYTQMSAEKAREMVTSHREISLNGKKGLAPNVSDQIKITLGKVEEGSLKTSVYNAKTFGPSKSKGVTNLKKGQSLPIVKTVLVFGDRTSAYKIPFYEKVELDYETINKAKEVGTNRHFDKNQIYCLPDTESFTKAEELLIAYGAALENLESKLRTLTRYEDEIKAALSAGEKIDLVSPLAVKVEALEPEEKPKSKVWEQPFCNRLEVLKQNKRQVEVRSFFKGQQELNYGVKLREKYFFAIDLATWERLEVAKQEIEIAATKLEQFLTQELRTYAECSQVAAATAATAATAEIVKTPEESSEESSDDNGGAILLTTKASSLWTEIKSSMRNQLRDELKIGLNLLELRQELDVPEAFGQFIKKIVAPEWGLSESAAIKEVQRSENIAKVFKAMLDEEGSNSEDVFATLNKFPKSVLQLICAPRVPLEAREKAIEMANAGVRFSVESIKVLIGEHKELSDADEKHKSTTTVVRTVVVNDSETIDNLKKQYEAKIEQLKIKAEKAEIYEQENQQLKTKVDRYEKMFERFNKISKGVGLSEDIKAAIPPDKAEVIDNSLRFLTNRIGDLEAELKAIREERDSLREITQEDALSL